MYEEDGSGIGHAIGFVFLFCVVIIVGVFTNYGPLYGIGLIAGLFVVFYFVVLVAMYKKLRKEEIEISERMGTKVSPRWVTALGAVIFTGAWFEY